MWHVVCGDVAAKGVRQVIDTEATSLLRIMRDDLAVGPLVDVHQPPCPVRSAFWEAVWPDDVPAPDFSLQLADDATWLEHAALGNLPITLWHGDSASEQLLLCRIAAALHDSSVALYSVPCGTHRSDVQTRRAVGQCSPELLKQLYSPGLILPEQQQELARAWHEAVEAKADIRQWLGSTFRYSGYEAVDTILIQHCTSEWQPLTHVMAEAMVRSEGFFATDTFLGWRARDLAHRGLLVLQGPEKGHYSQQMVCLPTA
ncbi:DUF1835 domain-containing protein [Pseudomonas sp.]|uniref:DUF1835 domain-containing protein n=1 Tax=Pseudomonas sp. TaxID=306 RepID=UPI0028AEC5D1|nr:DUF1835 domain-containing protein [Pseudomonas sp.]